MHPSLARLDHRPWPLPVGAWRWRQSWCDLLFAHWPVPSAALRPLIPPGLTLQEHDGTAWLALVPFRMAGVMLRPFPDLPGLSAFPEVNVRTYVECDGRPGVWFLSLDATQPLAVWMAQRFFHLPYWRAAIDFAAPPSTGWIDYRARRVGSAVARAGAAELGVRYRPTSQPYEAVPGTLEHWLTERYCLYAQAADGSLWRSEVHHLPWPLQRAVAEIGTNTMFAAPGLGVEGPPALLHFSRRIDVVMWSPVRVGRAPG